MKYQLLFGKEAIQSIEYHIPAVIRKDLWWKDRTTSAYTDIIGVMTTTVDVAQIIPFAHILINALQNVKRCAVTSTHSLFFWKTNF